KKQFHGIGVVLRENEEGVYIADLITGGPAYASGLLKVGDIVTAIDGQLIQEMSFDEVLERLRGEENSSVELSIQRTAAEFSVVRLKRQKIVLHEERLSYSYEPYADGVIGKIVLPGFYDNGEGVNSEKDLREAIRELKVLGPVYGIVIDLRENSGGFLSQAVKVAGLFITKGVIVISKYSDGEIRYMRDLDGRLYYQGPLVLLTSKASASAAEIVAQALQDYGVAIIVGDERTYGKGSMQYQTVMEESAKVYFKVTVGRYYTISGRSTQIEGVLADVVVPTVFSPYNIGERYLEFPLPSDQLDLESVSIKGFQKKYLPTLQVKETEWKAMIPLLKANSEKRLTKDENFQSFLRKIRGGAPVESPYHQGRKKGGQTHDFGVEDLQVKESVNILKDMIYLKQAS
ncbi:MAG: PDZ domain-containing protein, partial [Chlamydiae bacterium]|nr:PDZ domain-containing protein [Chlamydiota bacterium]